MLNKLLILLLFSFSIASCYQSNDNDGPKYDCGDTPWNYGTGTFGEPNWHNTCYAFAYCNGKWQSPVDLSAANFYALDHIQLDYKESKIAISNSYNRTIKMAYDTGSYLVYLNQKYPLEEITFHTPAEHTIGSLTFPIEIQLLHANEDRSKIFIVSVLCISKPTGPSELDIINSLIPTAANTVNTSSTKINIRNILPAELLHYAYTGSFTQPPCTQNIQWFVLKNTASVTASQVNAFLNITGPNNRPVKPLNGRGINVHP
jgi:carbonic anhydrase